MIEKQKEYLATETQSSRRRPSLTPLAIGFGSDPLRGPGTAVPDRWEYLDEKINKLIFSLRYSHLLVAEPLIESMPWGALWGIA